jgi:hypothetical protein
LQKEDKGLQKEKKLQKEESYKRRSFRRRSCRRRLSEAGCF